MNFEEDLADARNRLDAARIRVRDYGARTELDGIANALDRMEISHRRASNEALSGVQADQAAAKVYEARTMLETLLKGAIYRDGLATEKVVSAETVEDALLILREFPT